MIEPKFVKGDYIINRACGDMAIVSGINKKGYYTFKAYYGDMFKEIKSKDYTLQVNYQKFYEPCTEEEKQKLDNIIKENGGK